MIQEAAQLEAKGEPKCYDNLRMPGYPDWIKSRLFWRIRSGQEPLKYAPPTAYSCPWYELIEVAGPHDCHELIVDRDGSAHVNQCRYKVLGKTLDGKLWLGYGPYRFVAWNGPTTYKTLLRNGGVEETTREVGWIEYTGIEDEKSSGTAE